MPQALETNEVEHGIRRSDRKENLILQWELGGTMNPEVLRRRMGTTSEVLWVDGPERKERGSTVTQPGQAAPKYENMHRGRHREPFLSATSLLVPQ